MNSSSRKPAPRQVPPPTQVAGVSTHARFIPREELIAYTNWRPGALGPAAQPASTEGLNAPIRREPGPSLDAQSLRSSSTDTLVPSGREQGAAYAAGQEPQGQAIDLEALQQAARQTGYHDGYRDGLAALESFKRSFAQQMAGQIGHLVTSVEREFQALEADMAQSLVSAATAWRATSVTNSGRVDNSLRMI